MGWTVGMELSRVGRLGCVWDVPGTLGWDGQWDWSHLEWDARDMSGMFLGFPRLWDGIVGLEPSRVGCLGHVWNVLGFPRTLGWDGQWDLIHLE